MEQNQIIQDINEKYIKLGENPETYLKGLLQTKPINYWDYVSLDTLLTLQQPKTEFKDEEIFIMYHQITELVLKLILHEIRQIVENNNPTEQFLLNKLNRLNRYTGLLINSFDIMKDGMDYNDYNTFRTALAPASGFQSAQFRFIEIYCTRLENLINLEGKQRLPENPTVEEMFENIYWQDAGLNRKTGKKTLTLTQFEEKYLDSFITLAKKTRGNTIEDKILQIDTLSEELLHQLKTFDRLYNIEWPLVHLGTAKHYLDSKGENQAATGGSEWKKYLHPKFQQRKFFPTLWTDIEKQNWGI
ncbi:MAG: tryptophan 2,3-dioxygenase [Sphingobacteriales bacterium]|nr:MAG: tryptophan 2,3-dioxygenase [Sphingobacteriales bacterium]